MPTFRPTDGWLDNWMADIPDFTVSTSIGEYPKIRATILSIEQAYNLYERAGNVTGDVDMPYDVMCMFIKKMKALEKENKELRERNAFLESQDYEATSKLWDAIIGQNLPEIQAE